MFKAIQVKTRRKELLQFEEGGDIFIYGEGKGMCQDGAINIVQKGSFDNEIQTIRLHKVDLKRLIEALQSKIPNMSEDNYEEARQGLQEQIGEGWDV